MPGVAREPHVAVSVVAITGTGVQTEPVGEVYVSSLLAARWGGAACAASRVRDSSPSTACASEGTAIADPEVPWVQWYTGRGCARVPCGAEPSSHACATMAPYLRDTCADRHSALGSRAEHPSQ